MSTTELSFLIELLLKHKLPPATKSLIAERIKDVEVYLNNSGNRGVVPARTLNVQPVTTVPQAASTLAALARHADAGLPTPEIVTPVVQVAQTPMAMQAMNNRSAAISAAISGKPEKGRTSPRKF